MNNTKTVLLIGDTNTGKTSIIRTYTQGDFSDAHLVTPLPISQRAEFSRVSGIYELTIWDTAGSEEWATMNSHIYQQADVIIFVVAIDNADSLNNILTFWKPKILGYIDDSKFKSIIAINKVDLPISEQIITQEYAVEIASRIDAEIFRVSAKENVGIREMFESVANIAFRLSDELNSINSNHQDIFCGFCRII